MEVAAHEVGAGQRGEDDQGDDLEDDAADGEVVAQGQLAGIAGRAGG